MISHNRFTEIMKQRSDVELIEITTRFQSDYQPEAIVAAKNEIKNRNLTSEIFELAEKELEIKHQKIQQNEKQSLETHEKILLLLLPGFINFFIAFIFKGKGYNRKFKETWTWTFYGFGFYAGLAILLIILSNFF